MARPFTAGPRPSCPDQHPGRVVFWGQRVRPDGLYAKSRYRCYPSDGRPPHIFTLPKRAPWHLHPDGRVCPECSHETGRTDGAPTALNSLFSVPEAAKLFFDLGRGSSLRDASRAIRIENGRWSVNQLGEPFRSRENALAADYLDRYGPALTVALRQRRWPRFLILDSTPLHMRVREAEDLGLPYETDGGALLVAAGTDDPTQPARAWHAALAANETGPIWFDFLDSVAPDSAPEWVVADDAKAIYNAVCAKWPEAVFYPCLYHLKERGRQAAIADGLFYQDRAIEPALDLCFRSTDNWERLRLLTKPHEGGVLGDWIEKTDAKARTLEPLRRRFGPEVPESNGAAEWVVREIARRIGKRKRNFLNAERLNTLIGLMRADLAGVASVRHYIQVLRKAQDTAGWSLGNGDDPGWRTHQDKLGHLASVSRLILEGKDRAVVELADIVRESQARVVARKIEEANDARAALGLPALAISNSGAVPTAKIPPRTMLTAFPELLRDWDPSNDRRPETISYGSAYRAKWICADCGHHWPAPVNQRVLRRTRCPACHRSWATPQTSLAALHPALVAGEWAAAENLPRVPERTAVHSGRTVLWRCRDYPDLHPLYPMSPSARLKLASANKVACPECRRALAAQRKRRRANKSAARSALA